MTSEALTVVRAFGDAFAAADFVRISETLDPDVVWVGTRGGLDERRVLRGIVGEGTCSRHDSDSLTSGSPIAATLAARPGSPHKLRN
jgi:hypothetical protein